MALTGQNFATVFAIVWVFWARRAQPANQQSTEYRMNPGDQNVYTLVFPVTSTLDTCHIDAAIRRLRNSKLKLFFFGRKWGKIVRFQSSKLCQPVDGFGLFKRSASTFSKILNQKSKREPTPDLVKSCMVTAGRILPML